MSPGVPLDPAAVASRQFATARRGLDAGEVRAYLHELSDALGELQRRQADLQMRLEQTESRAEVAERLDEHRLVELLGEETTRVLAASRDAAADIKQKAQESASRLISEANEQAHQIRADGEREVAEQRASALAEVDALRREATTELDRRRAEGNELIAEMRREAEAARDSLHRSGEEARQEAVKDAQAIRAEAQEEGHQLVTEAQLVRERMLQDLARRRRTAREQLERLHAARDRLLAAYEVVRRTVADATTELRVALPEAKIAGDQAMRRVHDEPEATVEELEAQVSMARIAGLLEPLRDVESSAPTAGDVLGDQPDEDGVSIEPVVTPEDDPARTHPLDPQPVVTGDDELEIRPTTEGEPGGPAPEPGPSPEPAAPEPEPDDSAPSDQDDPVWSVEPDPVQQPSGLAEFAGSTEFTELGQPQPPELAASAEPGSLPPDLAEPAGSTELDQVQSGSGGRADVAEPVSAEPAELLPPDSGDRTDLGEPVSAELAELPPAGVMDLVGDAAGSDSDEHAARAASGRARRHTSTPEDELAEAADVLADLDAGSARDSDDEATTPSVDELFARLRQGQHDMAEEFEAEPEYEPEPEPALVGAEASAVQAHAQPPAHEHRSESQHDSDDADTDPGDSPLERRDDALAPIERDLARLLKRALADEQNEVLDLLRRAKPASAEELLPDTTDHAERYADAARDELEAAANWGAIQLADADEPQPEGFCNALAAELGEAVTDPLRERIARSFVETGGDIGEVTGRIRALYREWKGQRIADAVRHFTVAAYAQGAYAALPKGTPLCWLVDHHGDACPDADDNALAWSVTKGEAFPTGDHCPPAHLGCRCLVVPDKS